VSVRLRLAAWFVLVMAVLVVATSAITYAIVRSDLRGEAQRSAREDAQYCGDRDEYFRRADEHRANDSPQQQNDYEKQRKAGGECQNNLGSRPRPCLETQT